MTEREPVPEQGVTRLLLAGGAIGPPLFVIALLIEGATRSGYDPARHAGSLLSLSDQGWQQIANFIITGLLVLGLGIGLRRVVRSGLGSQWGPILIMVAGIGLVMAGIFPTPPEMGYPPGTPAGPATTTSLPGTLHGLSAPLVFFGLPGACFVFGRRFRRLPGWQGFGLYSLLSGLVMLAFIIAFVVAHASPDPLGQVAGVMQRASIISGWSWMTLLAVRMLRATSSAEVRRPDQVHP